MTGGTINSVFNSRRDTTVKNYFTKAGASLAPQDMGRANSMLLDLGINLERAICVCGGPLEIGQVCKDCLDKDANYSDGRERLNAEDQLSEAINEDNCEDLTGKEYVNE